MINNDKYITILNENKGKVYTCSLTKVEGDVFEPAYDGIPSETPITFAEFKYINNKSALFRDGILRVDPQIEDEVLKSVGIVKKSQNFLDKEEIKDIILNPTVEKLNKIIKITSPVTIDKVRSMLIELNNSDDYYIAVNVFNVINARYRELYNGKRNSDILIKKKKNEPKENKSKVEKLIKDNKGDKGSKDKKTSKAKNK